MFTAQDLLNHWRQQSKSPPPQFQAVQILLKHGVTWLTQTQFEKLLENGCEPARQRSPVYTTADFLFKFKDSDQYDQAWIFAVLRNHMISSGARFAPTVHDFFLHEVYRDLAKGLRIDGDPWRLLRGNVLINTGIKLNHPRPTSLQSWIRFLETEIDHQASKNQLVYQAEGVA